jgi:hypothetical protein
MTDAAIMVGDDGAAEAIANAIKTSRALECLEGGLEQALDEDYRGEALLVPDAVRGIERGPAQEDLPSQLPPPTDGKAPSQTRRNVDHPHTPFYPA